MEQNILLARKKRVLIVDDEDVPLLTLKRKLEDAGYLVTAVDNGVSAIQEFENYTYDVLLTDYDMEPIDGLGLVKALNEKGYFPVILVLTGVTEANRIITIMKAGVHDYLLKPYNTEELLQRVNNAFDVSEFKKMKFQVEQEKSIRTEKELSWNKWKEDLLTRSANKLDTYLFYNLKTALSQGSGFGSLLSLIFLISNEIQEVEGRYVIDSELMKLIKESAYTCSKILNQFHEIYDVVSQKPKFERTSIESIYDKISNYLKKEECVSIKNQKLIISDKKAVFKNSYIQCDIELLIKSMKELLINACKFSEYSSNIYLIFTVEGNNFSMYFLNSSLTVTVDDKKIQGIPREYEKLIFEPFFRLTKFVDERYDSLDFGLGLTLVDKIVYIHNGKISASNIQFHLNDQSAIRTKVEIEISLNEL